MSKNICGKIVCHTHWDRAWYLSFQEYRFRLERFVGDLLNILEQNTNYKSFMLDGQTVLLEDYLAVAPHNRERIDALVRAGRLQIGPWYTLPDLFLPSGECIVRNLQIGRQVAFGFGEPMPVGYVPDPFGHFAQLPQVLQGFGLDSFVFMRGANRSVQDAGTIFNWTSPDGSTVLAVYMQQGYLACSALGHPAQFGRFDGHVVSLELAKQRVQDSLDALVPLQKENSVLLMNGCDHMPAQPELPQIVQSLNAGNAKFQLEQTNLFDFFSAVRSEEIQHSEVCGDLIGNVHHPILLSVYSTRMYLKQLNHRSQSLLTRVAEPLSVFASGVLRSSVQHTPFLNEAWKILLRTHAHDNICGCSVDSVHCDDEVRFAECDQISGSVITEIMELLLKKGIQPPLQTADLNSNVFVFNPHPFSVKQKILTNILMPNPKGEWAEPTSQKNLAAVMANGTKVKVNVVSSEDRVARAAFLETTWGRRYSIECDVELAPMSYNVIHVFETESHEEEKRGLLASVIENNHYRVSATPSGVSIFEKSTQKMHPVAIMFEFENDMGDTYSFSDVPNSKIWTAKFIKASHAAGVSDCLDFEFELEIPKSYSREVGCVGRVLQVIKVRVGLSCTQGVEYEIEYTNEASDGRLRALFSIGEVCEKFIADGHFRLATRQNDEKYEEPKKPYPGEIPYRTHHQGDFSFVNTSRGRTWVANRGNPEIAIEQRSGESWFAITLHRSVGHLSVFGGSVRQCQAGPQIPTPSAQCLRSFKHALSWGAGNFSQAAMLQACSVFAHPLHVSEMPYLPFIPSGTFPREMSLLSWDNPNVLFSSFHLVGENGCALRLYNLTHETQTVELRIGFPVTRWVESSLDEMWSPESERSIENGNIILDVLPYEIRTILIS